MVFQKFQAKHPFLAFLFAFLGLAWCGYILFPTSGTFSCTTSACVLFQNFTIAGFSLWWLGVGYFFFLTLLCLRGYFYTAWLFARIALFIDAVLLAIMLFIVPCVDCLVVGAFFALTLLCLRPDPLSWFTDKPFKLFLLPIWFGLFLSNMFLAIDQEMPLLTMHTRDSPLQIFFSPSCMHCDKAIIVYGQTATFIPVPLVEGDVAQILKMKALVEAGIPIEKTLPMLADETVVYKKPSTTETFFYWIQLVRNKAAIVKQGYATLPIIRIKGMPSAMVPAMPSASFEDRTLPRERVDAPLSSEVPTALQPTLGSDLQDSDLLQNSEYGECKQNSTEPCL